MAVTAGMVKELREMTGVGMVECKNALVEADGNIEKAVELLREKGLAAAAKKAGRVASEGLVHAIITDDNKVGVVVEVNSETDFVAKNQEFRSFVENVALQVVSTSSKDVESLLNDKWVENDATTVKDVLTQKISVIGENLNIRRFEKFEKLNSGKLVSYIHGGGRVSVLVELSCEKECDQLTEVGKNICMQIAAMSPKFVSRENVPQDFIDKEREILTQQALNEGKPENIVSKMVEGRIDKELKNFCLTEQEYVKDGDLTVKKYLESVGKEVGADVKIERFVRFETGEGIEKKEENFADEVNKVMQG